MQDLWKAAVGIAGLSGVVSFVFWSLYKQWLNTKVLEKLNSKQLFRLFVLFLCLTFAFAAVGLLVYLLAKRVDASIEERRANSAELNTNATLYAEHLADRYEAGKAMIEDRRKFIRNAMEQRANRHNRAVEESDDLMPVFPSEVAVTNNHLASLDRFEAEYTRIYDALLEAAKDGEFVRCHEIAKDLRALAESPDARFAFSHHTVIFVRAGMTDSGTPRYFDADDFESLSKVVTVDFPDAATQRLTNR